MRRAARVTAGFVSRLFRRLQHFGIERETMTLQTKRRLVQTTILAGLAGFSFGSVALAQDADTEGNTIAGVYEAAGRFVFVGAKVRF